MTVQEFHEGLGAGKGAEPVPVDDGRGPRSKPFPFPRPAKRPADLHQSGHGLLPEVGFPEIEGAVGKSQGIPQRRSLSPVQPGHGQPERRQGRGGGAYALEALSLDAKSAYAHDVLGLAYANQGKMLPALQSLGQALRLAPKEEFIRTHYLQVRALYIERARLEYIQKKENSNEKTIKIWSVLLMIVLASSFAVAAVQKPAAAAGGDVDSARDRRARRDHGFRCRGRHAHFERPHLDHFDRCRRRRPDPGPVAEPVRQRDCRGRSEGRSFRRSKSSQGASSPRGGRPFL